MPVTFSESSTATFPQPAAGGRMTLIDADGDGDLDILYQTGANGTAYQYAQSNGNGTYTLLALGSSPFAGMSFPDHNGANFHVGDVDGDGDMDLWAGAAAGASTGSYFRNNGNNTFSSLSTATFPSPGASSRVVMGDFDNDGDADMLYQTVGNGTAFQFARSNGDGTYTLQSQAASPFAGVGTIRDNGGGTHYAGDFDGDGDMDIWAAAASTTGDFYRNDGGTFSSQSTATFPAPAAATRVAVGDFDSDGDDDILYQTAGNGTAWQYARSNGDGTFTILTQANSPFAGVTFVDHNGSNSLVGDVDGDGDDDLIITGNGTTGEFYLAAGKPPEIASSTPSDNGTGVAVGANITLTFDESVSKGTGNIYIYRGDGVLIETIAVTSGQVTGSGTTWTIDPSVTLAGLTNYYVLIDDGTWTDADGSIFFGVDNATTLNFTTGVANTAPTFTNLNGDSPGFVEGTPVRLDVGGNATVADTESANFDTGTITVSITANEVAGQDVLSVANIGNAAGQIGVSGSNISFGGVQIATFTGGTGGADLVITMDPDATPAAAQALVRALQYSNTSESPNTSARTVTIVLTDGDGGTSTTQTVTVGVTAVNDEPAGVDFDRTISEDGSYVFAASDFGFSDTDGHTLSGVVVTTLPADGVVQTLQGGVWTAISAGDTVTLAQLNASEVRFLADANENGAPYATFTFQVVDTGGTANSGVNRDQSPNTFTINVTAVDDAAVAVDDSNVVTESGTVSGTVFTNDSDADGPALTVAAVNGVGGNVNTQITLASGALLTLNSDGTYTYDPNGAFNSLADSGSGGTNIIADDTFTYTLTNGNTATVTVSVTGEDSQGDVVQGDGNPNILDGGAGDDTLIGGGGNDTLNGGSGSDTGDYSGAGGGVFARLNPGDAPNDGDGGTDTLIGIENLTGSAFNDILIGASDDNVLSGGAGYDQLIGGGGNDTLIGGSGTANQLQGGIGDDLYIVEANDTIVELVNQGTDEVRTGRTTFVLSANVEILTFTGAGAFTGTGNAVNNTLTGGAGDDLLAGRAGDDTLNGGGGLDTADYLAAATGVTVNLSGGTASDGDGGTDTLNGMENARGSGFADVLYGTATANVFDGGLGDDTLVGRGGNDTLRGGGGDDTVDYSDATSGVIVRLNNGSANDGEGGADSLVSIENIVGSGHDDDIVGSIGNNTLSGGAGRDALIGLAGNDTLRGGSGMANELFGGQGDDVYIVDALDTVVELAGQGTDRIETTLNNFTLAANIENLTFTGAGNFAGIGNVLANELRGSFGSDTFTGGGGDDTIEGWSGYDTVIMSGASSEYTIEFLGGTQYRITDSVGGRDGVDIINGVEQVRFTNVTAIMNGGVPAPLAPVDKTATEAPLVRPGVGGKELTLGGDEPLILPALSDLHFIAKGDGDPLVLPGVMDDDFLPLKLVEDGPLILPGEFDGLKGAALNYGNAFDLRVSEQGEVYDVHYGPVGHHDDWLL